MNALIQGLLLLLLAVGLQAGDFANTLTGELALSKIDRKYTTESALAQGWVPVDKTLIPQEALDEAARHRYLNLGPEILKDGQVSRRSWSVDVAGGRVVAKDAAAQVRLQEHRATLATRQAANRLLALLEIEVRIDKLAAIEATNPDWVTPAEIEAARVELQRQREATLR